MKPIVLKKIFLALLLYSSLFPKSFETENLAEVNETSWLNLVINEFLASNQDYNYDEYGEDDDWIEIMNMSDEAININGIYVTDDLSEPHKYQIFSVDSSLTTIYPDSFLILWADDKYDNNNIDQGPLHLPFKLRLSGEEIGIFTPDSTVIIDTISYGQQTSNISMGRQPGAETLWNFFEEPTPGSSNTTYGVIGISLTPSIVTPGGFYTDIQEINIEVDSMDVDSLGVAIFYTLDGSEPDTSSDQYQTAFMINQNTVVRARCIQTGHLPGKIATATYLFNEDTEIDVISLATDPDNLWGDQGIYSNPHENWEKPVHVEYYSNSGDLGFAIDGGVKIHAPSSSSQKSFRLYTRSRYGHESIQYQIFEDKPISNFKRLVLRNAGNDGLQSGTLKTHFRDAATHTIFKQLGADKGVSAYKPTHVYLNGNYWGIYNLRERIDKNYISSNYGFENDIDLLERAFGDGTSYLTIEGDWEHFNAMVEFAVTEDLSIPENYDYMKTQMFIEDFCDYWIFEIFVGNFDWLSNNLKLWRPRTSLGKWKWILWDLDHGLGLPLADYGLPEWNTLDWATSTYPGRPWEGINTRLIRNLLENEVFKNYFINRFADLLNSSFHPNLTVPIIDSLGGNLAFDIPRQIDQWGGELANWNYAVNGVQEYLTVRPDYIRAHVLDKFSLDRVVTVTINVEPEEAGRVLINTLEPDEFPWDGKYFSNIPISLRADPASGYVVSRWSHTLSDTASTEIVLTADTTITVYFEQVEPSVHVVINEINYNSFDLFNSGDWLELYNPNPTPVDLTSWQFRDEGNVLIFPEHTTIPVEGYLILSSNPDAFADNFPDMESPIVAFDFGLADDGEIIQLFSEQDSLIDWVAYDNGPPWPEGTGGSGYTLELISPELANEYPQSWAASAVIGGSPGGPSTFVGVEGEENLFIEKYALLPNYPNPFNSITTIRYELPTESYVKISVYSLLGQEVAMLVSQKQPRGVYRVAWDAGGFPSGVYFYRLETDQGFDQAHRLILLK